MAKKLGFIKNMAEFVRNIAEKVLAEDGNGDGVWRTIKGSPVFIKKGQSIGDAINEKFKKTDKGISSAKASRLASLIEKKGGFSYQPVFHISPKDGFMVSEHKDREKVLLASKLEIRDITKYVISNADLFKKRESYFGAWKDEGNVYFDVSIRHDTKESALAQAKKLKELAIFDVTKLESISLDTEGGDTNDK